MNPLRRVNSRPALAMLPIFSCPMITGVLSEGGVLYIFTSVPQMPATSILTSALSSGISGMGKSRICVLLGPTLTAANTRLHPSLLRPQTANQIPTCVILSAASTLALLGSRAARLPVDAESKNLSAVFPCSRRSPPAPRLSSRGRPWRPRDLQLGPAFLRVPHPSFLRVGSLDP